MKGFRYKKSVQALCYFAQQRGDRLNKMKAIKLIWLADRLHLRRFGRTITGDVYFAMPLGPVASTTRDLLEENPNLSDLERDYSTQFIGNFSRFHFHSISKPDLNVFSKTDFECIVDINNTFGDLSQFDLSELSHKFPEWNKYESSLTKGFASRYEMDLDDFFINVNERFHVFEDDEDELRLSREIFHEKLRIDKVL